MAVFFDLQNEAGLDPVNFNDPQISEDYGSRNLGSAGSFDSVSDLDGDTVLFKNGNASYGSQANSTSRTVVDITFKNTGDAAVRPTLKSQILPAGMGIFMSDCSAENLRECKSIAAPDFSLEDFRSYNGGRGPSAGASFNFQIVSGDSVLFALTGSINVMAAMGTEPNTIVTELSSIESFLTDFRQSSALGSVQEISFDWGATDFELIFPDDLLPNESQTVSYITEVTTFTNAICVENDAPACPIAFGAFGDPIGRGGASGVGKPITRVEGISPGLYRMAAPTFEDGILTYRAESGPGIAAVAVPAPAPLAAVVLGAAFMLLGGKRFGK